MLDWAEGYDNILIQSSLKVQLLAGYVDDGRQVTTILEPEMEFRRRREIQVQ